MHHGGRHWLRLCCSLRLLENDPYVIEPDVPSSDVMAARR
jgi:hypothetical protein